jgi:hypothetical protein
MLETRSEVFEVHVIIGKGGKCIAAVDAEQAPNRRLDGDGRCLLARKRPDAELLGHEGGGCLINVNDHEYSVEFVAFDPIDVDRSAVSSVTLIVSMWRTIAEGVLGGGVAWAARYAIVRRAMVVDGIEALGATMGMRGTCRLRVAEAGLGAGSVQRASPPKRRKVESISARAGGARRWSSGRV